MRRETPTWVRIWIQIFSKIVRFQDTVTKGVSLAHAGLRRQIPSWIDRNPQYFKGEGVLGSTGPIKQRMLFCLFAYRFGYAGQ